MVGAVAAQSHHDPLNSNESHFQVLAKSREANLLSEHLERVTGKISGGGDVKVKRFYRLQPSY